MKKEDKKMIEGRGLGDKKVNRVNVSLSNRYLRMLHKLAVSCNMRPTSLAGLLIERSLANPQLIRQLQDEYCTDPQYLVLPINIENKKFIIYGGD
jgi:hypothetical protein